MALVALAAALRIAIWAQRRSLWIDEALLALNVASRSYLRLLPPLDFDQAAPLLYLWLQRFTVELLGVSEASLRLLALVMGIAAVALVYLIARRLFGSRVALLATLMAALSPSLIYFSNEAKQYGVEACLSCAILAAAIRWLENPLSGRRWVVLLGVGAVAVWLAGSAAFVLAGTGLAVLLAPGVEPRRRMLLALQAAGGWGASLVLAYVMVYRHAANSSYMQHYWSAAFLTPGRPGFLRDTGVALRSVLWGPVFRDSFAGSADLGNVVLVPAISIVIALLLVLGTRRLIRSVGASLSILVLLPPALAFLASALQAYPISARTTVFFLPALLILAAAGVDEMATRFRKPFAVRAILIAPCLPLVWIGARDLSDPDPRENLRPLVVALEKQRRQGEPVYVFPGAIPAWTFYTTDWRSPDRSRLEFLTGIAGVDDPAFENAPSRGRGVQNEGENLTYPTPAGVELYGIPTGIEARVFGLTNPRPDPGWSENEARRIRSVAHPRVWLIFSHFYGPEGELLRALEADGARQAYQDLRNSAALIRYDFPR